VIVCPTDPERALPASGAFWDLGVPQTARNEIVRDLAEAHVQTAAVTQRLY
jgi:TPP-dependent trihydroxycyclohexane-1,2-dione (THcHDO) dehydratase